tara:strand:+ start:181 stop:333 length:153 start_codon:yes stop_codon:yes gene_type:complete
MLENEREIVNAMIAPRAPNFGISKKFKTILIDKFASDEGIINIVFSENWI